MPCLRRLDEVLATIRRSKMKSSDECVYCARRTVLIARVDGVCTVQCPNCFHVWRSDELDLADSDALRAFAMRAHLEHPAQGPIPA